MNMRFYIQSVFVTLLMVTSALSDTWAPFEQKICLSPNGKYQVIIAKNRRTTLTASGGKELTSWDVVNLPTSCFLSNSGRYFVTMGQHGGGLWDSVGLAVYSRAGKLMKKWSVRQLVAEDDANRTVSSLIWFDGRKCAFSNDESSFRIHLVMEDTLVVNLTTFGVIRNRIADNQLDAPALFRRGRFYGRRDIKRARKAYDRGLKLSYSGATHLALGELYISLKMYDEAEAILRDVIRKCSSAAASTPQERDVVPLSYYRLHEMYEEMGRLEDSLEAIEKGHTLMWRPHDEFEKALGIAYLRNGKDEKAKEAFQKYIEIYGRDGISRTRLAVILLKHGRIDWALAEANLAVAVKDRGSYPESAFWTLGDVHRAMGSWSKAKDAYIKARDLRIAKGRSTYEIDKLITDMKARISDPPVQRK
jgi:tetratricopeptide (TPR) repeat protein